MGGVIVLILFLLILFLSAETQFFLSQKHIEYALIYFLVLHALLPYKVNFRWVLIRALGRNTLGIYLLHQSFLPFLMRLLKKINLPDVVSRYFYFFTFYILIVAISFLCTLIIRKYIEKPFLQFVKIRLRMDLCLKERQKKKQIKKS